MMKSYKKRNYEQALIETILKFDELLKSEKINEHLKNYSKRRVQNNNNNFNIDLMNSKNNMCPEGKLNEKMHNENNINNNANNNISEKTGDDSEKEIANFDNEFHKICEKVKDENDLFPLAFDDKMKMKIIESDFDGILDYFNSNLIGNDAGEGCKMKNFDVRFSKSQSIEKNYFESN